MESFLLSQEDLLFLSLTANALFLLHLLVRRLVELIIYLLRGRCWLVTCMAEINRTRPGLVARVLSEHLTLWTLVVLVVVCLRYTAITTYPFLLPDQSAHTDLLVRVVLYISTTRSAFLAGRLALSRDVHVVEDHAKSRTSVGPTGNVKADCAYALFDAGAKFICLAFRQNLFLGVTSPFYELNSTTLDFYRLMELLSRNLSKRTMKNAFLLNVITCVLCRVALPIVFLILALLNQSPLGMDTVPLVSFFACGLYHFVFHSHSLYQSILMWSRPAQEALPLPPSCRSNQSGPPRLDALSNDIHDDSASLNEKAREGFPLFKRFNYIFMRSYDNRNLTSVFEDEGSEKMNILKRKDVSKNSLLYKPRRGEESTFHDKAPPTGTKDELNNQLDQEFTTDESLLGSPLEEYREEAEPNGDMATPAHPTPETYILDVRDIDESSSHTNS